jgi:hypothetical protein
MIMRVILASLFPAVLAAASVPLDLSGVREGPVKVNEESGAAIVRWTDRQNREWRAVFSLDPAQPLITSISVARKNIVERAAPVYWCQTGKRRGGWDEFFDFPPSHPDGTRSYTGTFRLSGARAVTVGDRVELSFDGFRMGIFEGSIRYVFYPGSRLVQQMAIVKTDQPDTAFFYDAGLRMTVEADRRPGGNMDSEITYYDTEGKLRVARPNASEKQPVQVRYRTLAARTGTGSIAVFPPPHQYFMPRDFTTNMGYLWHTAWRGSVWIGARQLPDDNSRFYPWMNVPPGTEQRLSLFYLLDDREAKLVLEDVLRYTNRDRFARLEGYRTVAPHWHFAYTVQAMEKGYDWTPPFKPVLEDMGVDAAIIMDFHGDGHPQNQTELRLKEIKAFYEACRAQSDDDFLLIPSEEANVHYGGHWSAIFPKPVYWFMAPPGTVSSKKEVPGYGTVYTIGDAKALLQMMHAENGYAYQTHPRTKGSKEYPDKIRSTEHFLDRTYLGAGWKAMPADLSSPRLGERALKLLDDMSNWGLRKLLIGEVDVFQIDSTHELYSHMNINYVRAPRLPAFDSYGELLEPIAEGRFFVSTGEVLLPETSITQARPGALVARATVQYTFPLQMAEVVWGDGAQTHRKIFPLETTREFGRSNLEFQVDAPASRWARLAVWDVAGNGAFVNPTFFQVP